MSHPLEAAVFLSHNSADKSAVESIKRRLENHTPPIRCWFDKDDLRAKGTWVKQIEEALAACETAAVLYGPSGRGPIHDLEKELLLVRAARHVFTCKGDTT